ncbi:hypothetical protein CROQUDRAFT_524522 [Cronartium quercuum f. sp. fusiforme G11]|uniref:Uncharacterized protein n=1 Tax=Cronartium quercuum f. sp. fusiforme G11 TaxID=708437 RepID=A0A9P6NMT8_9BASI|nr:hypothetical protein CROQUDRAFT_524522 [Cronartium quercuum f. sp. fusiforme G11]
MDLAWNQYEKFPHLPEFLVSLNLLCGLIVLPSPLSILCPFWPFPTCFQLFSFLSNKHHGLCILPYCCQSLSS